MRKLVLISALLFSFTAKSQCLFTIDTTITITPHTLNLTTQDLISSGCCGDTLWLTGGDTTWFIVTFLITSNTMVIDYNYIASGLDHCTAVHQYGGWNVIVGCDTIQPDLTVAVMPYANANIIGFKQFTFPDSIIGKMAIATHFFVNNSGKPDSCHIRPCAALHQTGNIVLSVDVTQVPIKDPYPNPANESVRFELPSKRIIIEVFSMQGQRMFVREKDQGQTILDVGTLDLPTGVYLFRLIDMNSNSVVKKVTVIH